MQLIHQIKALADETRLRLLGILGHHELNVGELVLILGMGQSRISRHLKILTDAGFVCCKKDGACSFYSINRDSQIQPLCTSVQRRLPEMPEHHTDIQTARAVLKERQKNTSRFFDTIATDWECMARELLGHFDLSAAICEHIKKGHIVADLGCGPGLLLKRLLRKKRILIGVDNAPGMLDAACELLGNASEVSLRLGDLEHLPLRDAEVDCAVLSLVLHHLPVPQAGLLETARIVKPGGQMLLAEFLAHNNENLRKNYGDRWLGFRLEELKYWMNCAGFTLSSCKQIPINSGLTLLVVSAQREIDKSSEYRHSQKIPKTLPENCPHMSCASSSSY